MLEVLRDATPDAPLLMSALRAQVAEREGRSMASGLSWKAYRDAVDRRDGRGGQPWEAPHRRGLKALKKRIIERVIDRAQDGDADAARWLNEINFFQMTGTVSESRRRQPPEPGDE